MAKKAKKVVEKPKRKYTRRKGGKRAYRKTTIRGRLMKELKKVERKMIQKRKEHDDLAADYKTLREAISLLKS
jgi:hypothetical protein